MAERTAEELSILAEMEKEYLSGDPVHQRCRVVRFLSESSGSGRRRQPREVHLLIVDNKYAHQIIKGEIRGRRDKTPLDVLALEILTDVPYEERSVDMLLRRALKINLHKTI